MHTFGRKALLIRNILSTLILKLKLQSFSAMLKIDPLATYLNVVRMVQITKVAKNKSMSGTDEVDVPH